uniref:Oxidoreductase GLYR1 homolog n=1 Tax=Culex pipiens TaxID=7175 RepID=A0A8D8F282_CULPI
MLGTSFHDSSCYKLQLVFGNCGVISVNLVVKGYVEMAGVAPETSQDIAEEIIFKGGRYFFLVTTKHEGTLIILAGCDCCSKSARPASKPSRATRSTSGTWATRPRFTWCCR